MESNQVFNLNRFRKYALHSFLLQWRQLLLYTGVFASLVFIVTFLFMLDSYTWTTRAWKALLIPSTIAIGFLLFGVAFPGFRSKEKTITDLMIPASVLEKYIFEFFGRLIFFVVVYSISMYIFGYMAAKVVLAIWPLKLKQFEMFNLINTLEAIKDLHLYLLGLFAVISVAFAGSTTFRSFALVKTLVFIGIVALALFVYFMPLFEFGIIQNSCVLNFLSDTLGEDETLGLLCAIIGVFAMLFAFFKLKEKEV